METCVEYVCDKHAELKTEGDTKTKVTILGHTGMLGSMVYKVLKEDTNLEVIPVGRKELDVGFADHWSLKYATHHADWLINCIGIIKQKLDSEEEAIRINSLFPYMLSKVGSKVIQIATDCVYSGLKGEYIETDKHDALDVYGKTKSLGEVHKKNFFNIRCSIIGSNGPKSLLDWFLNQPPGAMVNGYSNHFWNGITTYHFAKVCQGIIRTNRELPDVQHLIPKDTVTKENLLRYIAKYFDREDINIRSVPIKPVDMTLDTVAPRTNKLFWKLAGYDGIPTIEEMVKELAEYKEGGK